MTQERRTLVLVISLLLASELASGEERFFPDIYVHMGATHCLCRNQGGRLFGQWYLSESHHLLDTCFPGGQTFADINGDRWLDEINEMGVFLGYGDGQQGMMTVAFLNQDLPSVQTRR